MPFRDRRAYDAARKHRESNTKQKIKRRRQRDAKRPNRQGERLIVGIDGEGLDTPDGRHLYIYLCAVNERGEVVSEAWNENGLSHEECIEMLFRIPRNTLKFGFMFSYDVTKIIEEMSLANRYYLLRPNLRRAKACRACKHTWNTDRARCPECDSEEVQSFTRNLRFKGRDYGFFNGSFSVSQKNKAKKTLRSVKIWDVFRFFGCAFVKAIEDWKVATPEQIARIAKMKGQRGDFKPEQAEEIRAYCKEECHLLALKMRKLIDAHEKAEIPLKRFEGAGSTASALLTKHKVSDFRGPRIERLDPELRHAIMAAFFGGRFENSTIGLVERSLYSFDIASAYPYEETFLPCLACGTWEKTKSIRKVEQAQLAVCAFEVGKTKHIPAWGPLPCRLEDGSISYGVNFKGWAWWNEFEAALEWPIVHWTGEAWIYRTDCDHAPFGFLPNVYRKRCEWGKEGPGIVLKLGANASYGKTAQTLGEDPKFQHFAWAGPTTSGTRGKLLRAILTARDPYSVLAVATDGLVSMEDLKLERPLDTGTYDLVKPLGVWERKEVPEGGFFAKPGLYFRLGASLDDIRARGVGRKEVFADKQRLIDEFLAWDRKDFDFGVTMLSRRFYGAKTSVMARSGCGTCDKTWPGVPESGCPECGNVGDMFSVHEMTTEEGKPAYGTWAPRKIKIGFDPYPKRERLVSDGPYSRLSIRDLGGITSAPYSKGETTPEGIQARLSTEFALEQPDWED